MGCAGVRGPGHQGHGWGKRPKCDEPIKRLNRQGPRGQRGLVTKTECEWVSQLATGCVTCHACHGCVTDFRPILGPGGPGG